MYTTGEILSIMGQNTVNKRQEFIHGGNLSHLTEKTVQTNKSNDLQVWPQLHDLVELHKEKNLTQTNFLLNFFFAM